MANVVVTGAAGFVGSHLVELLAAAGHRVVGVDRRPAMPAAAAERLVADLADPLPGEVADALRGAEAAFHLAELEATGVVNLGTGTSHRLDELAATVAAVLGRPVTVLAAPASRAEDDATLADTTRCRFLLGFVPLTDLPALVARQAAAAAIPVAPTTRLVEAV